MFVNVGTCLYMVQEVDEYQQGSFRSPADRRLCFETVNN